MSSQWHFQHAKRPVLLDTMSPQWYFQHNAARTSETLVNFCQTTRRYNPEDSHLRRRCRVVDYYFQRRSQICRFCFLTWGVTYLQDVSGGNCSEQSVHLLLYANNVAPFGDFATKTLKNAPISFAVSACMTVRDKALCH
jgi:hypothetical protein